MPDSRLKIGSRRPTAAVPWAGCGRTGPARLGGPGCGVALVVTAGLIGSLCRATGVSFRSLERGLESQGGWLEPPGHGWGCGPKPGHGPGHRAAVGVGSWLPACSFVTPPSILGDVRSSGSCTHLLPLFRWAPLCGARRPALVGVGAGRVASSQSREHSLGAGLPWGCHRPPDPRPEERPALTSRLVVCALRGRTRVGCGSSVRGSDFPPLS